MRRPLSLASSERAPIQICHSLLPPLIIDLTHEWYKPGPKIFVHFRSIPLTSAPRPHAQPPPPPVRTPPPLLIPAALGQGESLPHRPCPDQTSDDPITQDLPTRLDSASPCPPPRSVTTLPTRLQPLQQWCTWILG
jgi:hypothetical protein